MRILNSPPLHTPGVWSAKVISEVWALVYAPSYQPPESGEDMVGDSVPQVDMEDADGDGTYTATYTGFVEQGSYRVVVYAVDSTGLSARPNEAGQGDANKVYLPLVLKQ